MNETAWVHFALDKPVVADDYSNDRTLGAFVLIDRMTNQTAALGVVGSVLASPPGSRDRGRLRLVMRKAVNALVLWVIVFALSQNALLAAGVSVIEFAISPIVDKLLRSAWPDQPLAP
jgi:sulfate adenylyltransferase subunit 1 (EFTu-like GTPase family)